MQDTNPEMKGTTMSIAIARTLLPVLKAQTEVANAISLKIKDATSGRDERIGSVLTSSEDKEIVAWRVQDERVRAQIAEASAKLAEAKADIVKRAESLAGEADGFDVEEAKKEFLTARQEVTAIRKVVLGLYKGDEAAFKADADSAGIVEMLSVRGSGGTTSGVLGKRKPRLTSAMVDGVEVTPATFTNLAAKVGADLDTVKDAAFKAAGTDDLKSVHGTEITFTVVNKKSETVTIVIVPKDTDSKPKTDSVEVEVSEDDETDSE